MPDDDEPNELTRTSRSEVDSVLDAVSAAYRLLNEKEPTQVSIGWEREGAVRVVMTLSPAGWGD